MRSFCWCVLCFVLAFCLSLLINKQQAKSFCIWIFFLFEQKCVLNCWWNEHNASMHIWLGLIYLRQLCCQENHSKVEYLYRFFGSIFMINSLNPFGHNTKYTILSLYQSLRVIALKMIASDEFHTSSWEIIAWNKSSPNKLQHALSHISN